MHRPLRAALTIVAGLAVTLAASPARACDRNPAPPPAAHPQGPRGHAPGPEVISPYRPAHWEEGGGRSRELRHEYRRLERARDRFYATWDGRPWRRDRFEAWYGARRAELDRRWSELERWHGHRRWQG